ncbi:hypothetical protein FXN61_26195 [Lentzea sp. PSKA42]|uniref:DUF3558 domain-containing protein n=1 Tax=Lentzea indica TaxID=2604800 RepID=A0ABX1FN51_9PSEU|nr:hypothetical protein [Lentzea indica]NKE60101.1 hypothetical protein [Lentzea indica]
MRITLLAAAFLLAACTSTPEAAPTQPPAAPTTAEQPPGNGPNCVNANSSVVGKALGLRLQGQQETVEKTVITCKYVGPGMPVEVRFTTNATAASFAKGKPEKAKAVEGFLDEAYEATAGGSETTQHTVAARKGKTQIEVVSPVGVEPAKKLISELLGRI